MTNATSLPHSLLLAALLCSTALCAYAQEMPDQGIEPVTATSDVKLETFRELLLRAKHDPTLAEQRKVLVDRATVSLKKPIVRRAYNLEELKNSPRIYWDPRYSTSDESFREAFALGRSDATASDTIVNEAYLLASAYVLTDDRAYLQHALDQVEELTTWDPLQRPGWSSYSRQAPPPPDGDGVWLATGRGIQTCVEVLDILPPEEISPELRAAVDALFEREVARILDDWKNERPWYVRGHVVFSNQWALPMAGLVNATLFLGRDKHPEAYEYGVQCLLETMDSQGEKGEFVEGLMYSAVTVASLMSAAYHSALDGDRRLIDHPFLKNYPVWIAAQIQPGEYIVNNFDNGFGARGGLVRFMSMFSRSAVLLGSPEGLWVRNHYSKTRDPSLYGLLCATIPATDAVEPPLYNEFPKNQTVIWRDSWEDNASGFWMRGGSKTDFHDHQDRGHINFISEGRAILIEAGTFSYGDPDVFLRSRYVTAHNVLQVGDLDLANSTEEELLAAGQPRGDGQKEAPLSVDWLDLDGGSVSADMSGAYPAVKVWTRSAQWDAHTVEVTDEVVMETPDIALFRWHLAAPAEDIKWRYWKMPKAELTLEPGILKAEGYTIRFSANQPITARLETVLDNTIGRKSPHYCLVIRSEQPVEALKLSTLIEVEPTSGEAN
ncbi:heparinase II/III family protein [Ruficoccus sp. ZRK36]|uniref:heparinase II/III domain-containing protein n=1 Tax=Ruficoccus sp. ZRK36 TaxID=2866311 RepID=UPI001C72A325|nr:heparinase II/III family protein [Ruficoccus sp. ZRK36]QYY34515.1 heparinase II/III-family protein [Ruficoccus sp. ZRK36]